jgi:GNAT superfamily N-acetyltransferase
MIALRPLRWPDDRTSVLALDTSFATDRVYRLGRARRSLTLEEVPVAPPLRKSYPLAEQADELPALSWASVAVEGDAVVGLAAVGIEEWNRRALLRHLYVAPAARGRGVGRALVEAAAGEARRRGARCLWAETQTVNPGAVRFYERAGFAWCGADASLYDPRDVAAGEVALFFSRPTA